MYQTSSQSSTARVKINIRNLNLRLFFDRLCIDLRLFFGMLHIYLIGCSLMGFASTIGSLFDLTSILGLDFLLGFSSTIIIDKKNFKKNIPAPGSELFANKQILT
ncbi:hypothetical protein QL285_081418 [Trifolium repens]|nr:hypothetical protein QL285_081418 [Trifolium repens]